MTYIVGLALPNIAILAADTRININDQNIKGYQDGGNISITVPSVGEIKLNSEWRKIKKLNNNWIAGAGNFPLIYSCFKKLDNVINNDYKKIQNIVEKNIDEYKNTFPKDKLSFEKTKFFLIHNHGEKFLLQIIPENTINEYLISWPPDLTEADIKLISDILNFFVPENRQQIEKIIQNIATVFNMVYKKSKLIGPFIEIILVTRINQNTIIEEKAYFNHNQFVNGQLQNIFELFKPI